MTTPNPFTDVKDVSLPSLGDVGQTVMPDVASIKIGQGDQAFKADQSGIWLGANKFIDAPFSVDMNGNVTITSSSGKLIFDAINNRIIVNDGSNDRIVIGFQSGGF